VNKIADVSYGFEGVFSIAVSHMTEMRKGPERQPVQSQEL